MKAACRGTTRMAKEGAICGDDVGQLTRSRHWHCSYKDLLVVWTGKLPCAVLPFGCCSCPCLLWLHCYDILFLDEKQGQPRWTSLHLLSFWAEKIGNSAADQWPLVNIFLFLEECAPPEIAFLTV